MSVSTTVKTIQDIMRKDAGVDGDAQRINQLVWMFFLKIFDDRETEKEMLEDNYKSPIPEQSALAQLGGGRRRASPATSCSTSSTTISSRR